jgi:putative ABC transport system permease protein
VSLLRAALARLLGFFGARRSDARIEEEIAAHLDLLAAEFRARGMPPEEASLAARRAFGGVAQVREEWRRRRGLPWVETLAQDTAFALRQLRQNPGFAAAAILTLALGIGANTAIYQVLYAVVFRPLPVPQPQQLVELQIVQNGKPQHFSYPLFREMAARQNALEGMFAVSEFPLRDATLRGRGLPQSVHGALVTGDYFRVLGITARAGRVFTAEDDRQAAPLAVISDRFWEAEFDRSAAALGQTLDINQVVVTIVGIAPPGFFGETLGQTPDVWMPMSLQPRLMPADYLNAPYFTWLAVIGRLRSDVPPLQARAALDALYRQNTSLTITTAGPQAHLELHPASRGIDELRQFADPLYVLMATVGLVLLIAACNLANLLLSRASARTHEIGVRLALGAGRGRLLCQLLTESFVLSAIGGALALVLARWGSRALIALAGQQVSLPPAFAAAGFTAAAAIAVTCLFGIAPALAAVRVDVHSALQASRARFGGASRRQVFGRTLVVAQVSVSLLLVSAAGLLVRTLWNLRFQDFGFEPDKILQVNLPLEISRDSMRRSNAVRDPLYQRLNALAGVRVAAVSSCGPFSGLQHTSPFSAPGGPFQESDASRMVHVSPGYFQTMTRIVTGRGITAEDRQGAPAVAVLSQTAARRLFGAQDPVGRFVSGSRTFDAAHQLLVVGVAHDVHFTPRDPYGFIVYVPLAQSPAPITDIELRAAGDPARLAAAARTTIQSLDPRLRIGEIRLLRDTIDAGLTQEKMMAWLSAAFGALALLLTFVGVYGVIGYTVERRTQEIGIRLALGARRGQITALVLKNVGLLLGVSLLVGDAAALAAGRALGNLLFGIGNPGGTLAVAALSIAAVSMLAGYLPARRASRLDPLGALREE